MKLRQIHTILMVKNIEVSKRFYADVLNLEIL
jgi:catechol 2,3-dioxygenase-like lactoylglutathione lyase family enzyme